MLEKCEDAKRALSECINEMRDCINSANKFYRYCLQWPIAMVKQQKMNMLKKNWVLWVSHLISEQQRWWAKEKVKLPIGWVVIFAKTEGRLCEYFLES